MNEILHRLVAGIPSLGSYAGVLNEIDAVLSDHRSTLFEVSLVIENDPDLTARLLRLGNSALFGFPCRIETVSETVSLIGIEQVKDLIAASTVVEIFEGIPAELVNMESFLKHSLACGIAARYLAMTRRMPKPEKFFVAGLLHDVGRLVLYSQAPELAQRVFREQHRLQGLLREAEKKVLGFDHTELGAEMLRAWNYPPNLLHTTRYHHRPMDAGTFQMEASVVHIADILVNAMQLGSSGEQWVPALDPLAWERLGLPLSVLPGAVEIVEAQLDAVQQACFPTPAHRAS